MTSVRLQFLTRQLFFGATQKPQRYSVLSGPSSKFKVKAWPFQSSNESKNRFIESTKIFHEMTVRQFSTDDSSSSKEIPLFNRSRLKWLIGGGTGLSLTLLFIGNEIHTHYKSINSKGDRNIIIYNPESMTVHSPSTIDKPDPKKKR